MEEQAGLQAVKEEEEEEEDLSEELEKRRKTPAEDEEAQAEDDEDEDALPHSEILDIFEEGLARLVQDPLLCDLPIQVTLEEVNSQIALEYGQAMTVRVLKADGEVMPIVVVQNATTLDLKKAICRFMELKQQREGGVKHISCHFSLPGGTFGEPIIWYSKGKSLKTTKCA
ncbi:U11/U12 small nuclear ribonucleoprotein 25 kDa protein isoform X2 [Myripristis murdjan]|uniref:U11/U12 small nuclear ribonucleoprotein 25 kDa protein isoform X2 n=1 Tax=Myripristis murdjan TaxID=586833 RepID=UPI00117643CC|nr:U11/U12 small nuclear ribonucleoprotein 25 kDa protein isoform X2 [Myripristis murdjan]